MKLTDTVLAQQVGSLGLRVTRVHTHTHDLNNLYKISLMADIDKIITVLSYLEIVYIKYFLQ